MTRAEFLSSKGYWLSTIQLNLYAQLEEYMKDNNLNRTQLAEKLGVTKGYVSQILNADFDHKISKLVDLALMMGKAPQISYTPLSEYISRDEMSASKTVFTLSINSRALTRMEVIKNTENDGGVFSGNESMFSNRQLA
ncbi:helix-turn-helix domain-containing protein [Fibrella arboris]|uniref:helix-turn-helix domain-containing protein n=1 Tax=Fibrella arboris TaxID=3242486 RepID=UPI0035211BE9